MDFLGYPEPRWATILFFPGIWVGVWTWHNVALSIPLCHAAGVATMVLVGGALGAVLDLLINRSDP
jgi:hypothetical protein